MASVFAVSSCMSFYQWAQGPVSFIAQLRFTVAVSEGQGKKITHCADSFVNAVRLCNQDLINAITLLPGIGARAVRLRYAFSRVDKKRTKNVRFAQAAF